MTRWNIVATKQCEKSLRSIDAANLSRIKQFLGALSAAENPRVRGKPLSGNYSHFWRYRVVDFRVLVEIQDDKRELTLVAVGHRSEVYRR